MAAKADKRILVVEDDRGIQGLIEVLFARREFEVDTAPDGEEGLRKLRQQRYSAVLLDLMLPRVNGFEIVREMKAVMPDVLKRTIVVTAASDLTLRDFDISQVRRLLRKPFSISELVHEVESVVSEDTAVAPSRRPRHSSRGLAEVKH